MIGYPHMIEVMEARIIYRKTGKSVPGETLSTPEAVARFMTPLVRRHLRYEAAWCIPVDIKNRPFGVHLVGDGGRRQLHCDITRVFSPVVVSAATGFFFVHNHPSGVVYPSVPDCKLTRTLEFAAKILDVQLLDHLIVSSAHREVVNPHFSFRSDEGEYALRSVDAYGRILSAEEMKSTKAVCPNAQNVRKRIFSALENAHCMRA